MVLLFIFCRFKCWRCSVVVVVVVIEYTFAVVVVAEVVFVNDRKKL